MVDMRVRKNYAINRLGVEWKMTVFLERFFAMALKKPAIEKNLLPVCLYEMH
jgi:hypothetical protein